ncbi:MAG: response regulator [Elusimicrobia bacterium]|nr:response regulator [Candidatus Liberimonas magnetica]
MNKLITVVDDEEDILKLITINLKKNGFKTKVCSDCEGLFNLLKNKIPDLLLLDLMLPGMNGYEIFNMLKKTPQYAGIPIIMLTAKAEEADQILGLKLGADDYITKPFSPKALITRIKDLFRRLEEKDSGKK